MQTPYPTTPDEFLVWQGGGDFRWEFVDGEAVRLPRDGTRAHAQLIMHLACLVLPHVDRRRFTAAMSTFCVLTQSGVRMPDFTVARGPGRGDDLAATAPLLVAEVVSDWSRDRDLGSKRLDYFTIPSLRHYFVIAQGTMRVWLWSREVGGGWSEDPVVLQRADDVLMLPALGTAIRLDTLYSGRGVARESRS